MAARDELKRLCAAYHNARLDESVGTDTGETAVANAKFASLAAELSALRAVAEAADVLATTAQLAARHMPAGTIADLINDIAKVRAALDRVREGGGG